MAEEQRNPTTPKDASDLLATPGGDQRLKEALEESRARLQAQTQADPEAPVSAAASMTAPVVNLDRDAPQVSSFVHEAAQTMRRRARGEERPIPVPWPSVGEALGGGLWPGLHILVGNTASGKSQLALQLALEAARKGTPVLYIGLELGKTSLVARLLGLMSRKRWSQLWLGDDEDELAQVLDQHIPELESLPFHLDFGPPMGWSYDRLWETTRQIKERYDQRPPLVVLDYLQLIASPQHEPVRELRERIGRAAYCGRAVAREYKAAVLLVSSTARDNYRRLEGQKQMSKAGPTGKFPWEEPAHLLVGAGKESGEVEFAADTVIALVRGEFLDVTTLMHLAIAKIRAGKTSWQKIYFNGGWFDDRAPNPNGQQAMGLQPGKLSDLLTTK